jgi:predicted NAD-dependent protein-ADP-ribosyltransferase YbiA (DUF1768 family)
MVNNCFSFFSCIFVTILGVPYFEKNKTYPHYHRSRRYKKKKSSKFSTKIISNHVETDRAHQYDNKHLKRRVKRQLDFDPTAKHVEVLVAYDESIKHFHSDADIKSYILTLFSYVSLIKSTTYFI